MTDVTPETPRPAIAAAIITLNDRVLMVRRRVSEGNLSWQFPAGEVERGEAPVEAAAREANEETGVIVSNGTILGERIHPNTGRTMLYVGFDAVEGDARVIDTEELDSLAWVDLGKLDHYVPYGLFPPVQEYLNEKLSNANNHT